MCEYIDLSPAVHDCNFSECVENDGIYTADRGELYAVIDHDYIFNDNIDVVQLLENNENEDQQTENIEMEIPDETVQVVSNSKQNFKIVLNSKSKTPASNNFGIFIAGWRRFIKYL